MLFIYLILHHQIQVHKDLSLSIHLKFSYFELLHLNHQSILRLFLYIIWGKVLISYCFSNCLSIICGKHYFPPPQFNGLVTFLKCLLTIDQGFTSDLSILFPCSVGILNASSTIASLLLVCFKVKKRESFNSILLLQVDSVGFKTYHGISGSIELIGILGATCQFL